MAVVTAKVVLEHKQGLEILSLRFPSPGGEPQVSLPNTGEGSPQSPAEMWGHGMLWVGWTLKLPAPTRP